MLYIDIGKGFCPCQVCGKLESTDNLIDGECPSCRKPYSDADYEDAKSKGLNLDDWSDYQIYYNLGERIDAEAYYNGER